MVKLLSSLFIYLRHLLCYFSNISTIQHWGILYVRVRWQTAQKNPIFPVSFSTFAKIIINFVKLQPTQFWFLLMYTSCKVASDVVELREYSWVYIKEDYGTILVPT